MNFNFFSNYFGQKTSVNHECDSKRAINNSQMEQNGTEVCEGSRTSDKSSLLIAIKSPVRIARLFLVTAYIQEFEGR